MTNQESFVAFYPRGKAHYKCMKEDDAKPKTNFDW
jgi:hypothetical protein